MISKWGNRKGHWAKWFFFRELLIFIPNQKYIDHISPDKKKIKFHIVPVIAEFINQ